jgi:hypothetical protein
MTAERYRPVLHVLTRTADGGKLKTSTPLEPRTTRKEAQADLRHALWDRTGPRDDDEIGRSGSIETIVS